MYTYIGYKRKTQFFICFVVGKWINETCDEFYKKLSERIRFPTRKRKLILFSDGNKQNFTAIAKFFHLDAVRYGIKKKIKHGDKIVGIVREAIYGNPPLNAIGITQIDGFCSKLRERISCFTRKARSFAKRKTGLEDRLEIFSVQHNLMEKKKGKTPAMREELTSKRWDWSGVLHFRLSYLN